MKPDLRSRVLSPALGPVDVEFEFILLTLLQTLTSLEQSPARVDLQKKYCQDLRTAKMIFENKIATMYGAAYRGNSGGLVLLDLADYGMEIFQNNSAATEPTIPPNVRTHRDDIQNVQTELIGHTRAPSFVVQPSGVGV